MGDPDKPVVVHDNDVLFGRGGKNCKHSGNQHLRAVARRYKNSYSEASKKGKSDIARSIVAYFRGLAPPGRFLRRDELTGQWVDVGDDVAREKASQTLRDARASEGLHDSDQTHYYQYNPNGRGEVQTTRLPSVPQGRPGGLRLVFHEPSGAHHKTPARYEAQEMFPVIPSTSRWTVQDCRPVQDQRDNQEHDLPGPSASTETRYHGHHENGTKDPRTYFLPLTSMERNFESLEHGRKRRREALSWPPPCAAIRNRQYQNSSTDRPYDKESFVNESWRNSQDQLQKDVTNSDKPKTISRNSQNDTNSHQHCGQHVNNDPFLLGPAALAPPPLVIGEEQKLGLGEDNRDQLCSTVVSVTSPIEKDHDEDTGGGFLPPLDLHEVLPLTASHYDPLLENGPGLIASSFTVFPTLEGNALEEEEEMARGGRRNELNCRASV